jgi:hypothetical protein
VRHRLRGRLRLRARLGHLPGPWGSAQIYPLREGGELLALLGRGPRR